MRLLLIRHGQTPANVAGALATGAPGPGLTSLGQAQARAIPSALAGEDVRAIHVSTLVRTHLTAAPLAEVRGLPASVRPGLEEVSAGDLEMRSDRAAVQGYAECLGAWMTGDLDRATPGGPDGHAFWRRFGTAMDRIAGEHPDDTVVVVSHGAAIRVWTTLAAGIPPAQAFDMHIENTGMAVLQHEPALGWRLEQWVAHPVGGLELRGTSARDVTGESVEDVDDQEVEASA